MVKLASILCDTTYVPAGHPTKAVDFMQKILPPIKIGASTNSGLGVGAVEEGLGAAEAEVGVVGFESDKAEGLFWEFPHDVAEPSELRSKNAS